MNLEPLFLNIAEVIKQNYNLDKTEEEVLCTSTKLVILSTQCNTNKAKSKALVGCPRCVTQHAKHKHWFFLKFRDRDLCTVNVPVCTEAEGAVTISNPV